MRARLVRTVIATTAVIATLGLAGCTATDDAAVSTQQVRNDAAQELAAARQATLVPVASRLELLDREKQRAELAGSAAAATDVERRIDAYSDLAASIEAAPSAAQVRTLVDRAGLELGPSIDDSAVPTAAPAAAVPAAALGD